MKHLYSKSEKNVHRGFTLIEVMVSILIFSTALIALMGIAGRGISATEDVSSETTAHYLAQEGLEVVRNVRDSNFVSSGTWDAGFGSGTTICTKTAPCQVSYVGGNAPILTSCTNQTNNPDLKGCPINQNSSNNFYTDGPGDPSGFYREVYVTPITSYEYLVTSIVTWDQKTVPRSVTLETVLTNWEP